MPLTLYDVVIPVFLRYLDNLTAFLKKGEAWAKENSIPSSKILETRLAPDMYALVYQIQRISDTAKGAVVRTARVENPVFEDNEKTFEDLYARIQKTAEFLKSVDPKAFEGKEDLEVILKFPQGAKRFKSAKTYLLNYAIPNFFFHVTTAYDILRHAGVPVGKRNFIGLESFS